MAAARGKISPSLMCANFLNLERDLDLFVRYGIEMIHIDIMDGHYVHNFTLGIGICEKVAAYTDIPLDIHLMIDNPDSFVQDFAGFSGATVTFHPETADDPPRTAQAIRNLGARAGIALRPDQPFEAYHTLLPHVDVLCVMTVVPGFAGQRMVPGGIERLKSMAVYTGGLEHPPEIMVDGNVSWENLPRMRRAGAGIFVAGTSSLFERGGDLERNIRRFRAILAENDPVD
jgi:ribulose-phosphate 3-epimerase